LLSVLGGGNVGCYAVPISARDLRKGEVYFTVQFADEKLLVPIVEPLNFVGRNLEKGDSNALYFQKFGSSRRIRKVCATVYPVRRI
jgi:hypothetical protein